MLQKYMKYIIQDSVLYDPQDGTLRSVNKIDEVIILTKTASSLLYVILSYKGIIKRDFLIESVWGSQGLAGSYNNLNQYLSILRKAFRQYGLDDIILSMPRMGVQFNPSIHVTHFFEDDSTQDILIEEPDGGIKGPDMSLPKMIVEPEILSSPSKFTHSGDQLRLFFYYFFPGILFLLSSSLIILYILYDFRSPTISDISKLPVSDCDVYALEKVMEKWKPSLAGDFFHVKMGLQLQCDEHNKFFFHYDSRLKYSGLGNTLLAQCTSRGDNPYGYCNNFFFYNWR